MKTSILITPQELAEHLEDPDWFIADCRFALSDPNLKQDDYRQAHIAGAVYVHLDRDMSAPILPGLTGRHPLPDPETAARRFGQLGISPGMKVIAYDDAGGSLAAVRLWWMLRWLGHLDTAVLDGGWQAWLAEDYPVCGGWETRPSQRFSANPRPGLFVTSQEVDHLRQDPSYCLFDVRAAERYRGEVEPIDPVAGHIPGARNVPYLQNLDEEGAFRSPEQLRAEYQALLGDTPVERVVFYCGSGVTSIHSLLALLYAGLGEARLYAGSWSEWIADPGRPVATGPAP